MQRGLAIRTFTSLLMMALITMLLVAPSPAFAAGATQISGIGVGDTAGECNDDEGSGADFVLTLTGDLDGCHYVFVETAVCTPSGVYKETGHEIFVGTYDGQSGTFRTTYKFQAKYDDCANLDGQIIGRCQHPLIKDSGTGVFEGVTGRLDFKDDIEAGNAPYRGHLKW